MRRILYVLSIMMLCSVSCMAQTLQQADSLHNQGRELMNQGKILESRECSRQAMEIRKLLLGEVNEDYITSLNNYALSFSIEEDYVTASGLQEHMMDLCSQLNPPHSKLGLFARNAGYTFYQLGDKKKAITYWETALPVTEKFSKEYESLLSGLSLLYSEIDDREGIYRIMALMEEHNQHELTLPCDEPNCMLERAQYYGTVGNQAKAKECYLMAMELSGDDSTTITIYETYAQYMGMVVKDRETAAEYQYKVANLRKNINGKNDDYAKSSYLAGLYYSFAMTTEGWRKALECYDAALDVYNQSGGIKVAECQHMKGNAFCGLRNYAKAKECFQNAVAYYEANDRDHKNYPKMIERLASAEKFNKDYDASISHYQQALQIYEERGMMQEYADALTGLDNCYTYATKEKSEDYDGRNDEAIAAARIKQLDELIAEEKDNLDLTRTYLGKMAYARSLSVIAGCYAMKKNYNEAMDYYKKYVDVLRDAVRDEFRLQGETERMTTWEEEANTITELQDLLVSITEFDNEQAHEVATLAYDVELLSKGILLNSSIEFEKLLNNKSDVRLSNLYRQIKENHREIDRLRKEASSDADLEKILKLTRDNQRLQIEMNEGCREMEDFTRYISYDWKDVQDALMDHDVSIEFTSLHNGLYDGESHMIALVLTKEMSHPVAVTLWNNNDLNACCETELYRAINDILLIPSSDKKKIIEELRAQVKNSNSPYIIELSLYLDRLEQKLDTTSGFFVPDYLFALKYSDLLPDDDTLYTGSDAGRLVWGHISRYLDGKKRIFFSADGIFNNIGIEYMQYNGQPLSEQFEVYRLSSTKELCYKRDNIELSKSVLFGDINYNDQPAKSETSASSVSTLRGSVDNEGFADLGNTLREVNGIQSILRNSGMKYTERFRDTEASKSAFMNLSGSDVNMLHIATHGIYNDDKKSTDSESMQNSLLAFAGANIDDTALVTAADIATMDLRRCELAVLSACETGLGKLGGDGVFGLQRGFKNAGVRTLLMSLQNVYDDSTADLMIGFYKYMMSGETKRSALVKAQKELKEKGYTDPKYWATFILLDALE